jgi:hypothetical protein
LEITSVIVGVRPLMHDVGSTALRQFWNCLHAANIRLNPETSRFIALTLKLQKKKPNSK